jgi:hypothetical protein
LVRTSWSLDPSQRRPSYIPPISLCLYAHLSCRCKAMDRLSVSLLSVPGNGLVNTFPLQRIQATIE